MSDESIEIEFSVDEAKPKGRAKSRAAPPVEKFTFVMDGGKQAEPVREDKTFSFTNFVEEFDDHINQSIRGYSNLRDDIVSISRYFIEDDTNVIDIGCSQGSLISRIKATNTQAPNASYFGVDVNKAFKQHWKNERNLKYLIEDVRTWDGMTNLSLAISLFTFQFIPERDRLALMKKIIPSNQLVSLSLKARMI